MVEQWRLPPIILPAGDARDLWITDGRLTKDPVAQAEQLAGRFALPGLVDAHCHLAVGTDFRPLDAVGAREALVRVRDQGVLAVRDAGAPRSVTLDIALDDSLPTLQAAGRWLAPAGGFFAELHEPVPDAGLVEAALAEVAGGASWVKVVSDWAFGEPGRRELRQSYETQTLAQLIDAVHRAGARVAAHVQSSTVSVLVELGVDSVEHGFGLDDGTLRAMAANGIAWTPTLGALTSLPSDAPSDARRRNVAARSTMRELLPQAEQLGVTVLAGSDIAGTIAREVALLAQFGLSPVEALTAATTAGREFLRLSDLEDSGVADVVTYDADPREDPRVLQRPAAIVLRGRRVR